MARQQLPTPAVDLLRDRDAAGPDGEPHQPLAAHRREAAAVTPVHARDHLEDEARRGWSLEDAALVHEEQGEDAVASLGRELVRSTAAGIAGGPLVKYD